MSMYTIPGNAFANFANNAPDYFVIFSFKRRQIACALILHAKSIFDLCTSFYLNILTH